MGYLFLHELHTGNEMLSLLEWKTSRAFILDVSMGHQDSFIHSTTNYHIPHAYFSVTLL
jgi:hypothetical protein